MIVNGNRRESGGLGRRNSRAFIVAVKKKIKEASCFIRGCNVRREASKQGICRP